MVKYLSRSARSDVLGGKDFEMLKRTVLLVCTLALIAGVTSCIFDPNNGDPTPPLPPIKDLTQKEHVLINMELAYNNRQIDWYNGALDKNFTFFLSTGDIGNGLPDQWDRATEILYNRRMFDKNYSKLPCQSITMDIRLEDGVIWTEIIPESAPTEKWYKATLYYDFKIDIAPNTYIPLPGAQAEFTVRDAGAYGKYAHHWQLVQFRDLGGAS